MALLRTLDTARAAGNWPALAQASRGVLQVVPLLAAQGRWSAPERAALAQLRAVHARAAQGCDIAVGHLERQLMAMATSKEGWIAYALHNDNGNGTHP